MTTLATNLRNRLERVVTEAREVAETGASAALEALAVHHHEPYGHMTPDERKLRNRLRAHARQLGDRVDAKKGTHAIDHLVNECAYEHWHRMLFARFLAENNLLIEPDSGVAISLQECEDLAKEQKADPWTLASRYAQRMLPQIFRPDDPLLQITFAREHRLKLEQMLESLEPAVFTATDSLGWVYQFWQSRRKDEVNKSGNKIGADELPAVTQLFTEPYMVHFLIHNSLGAWHAGKVLAANPALAQNAASEAELRQAVALPGVSWDYLRFVKNEDGRWQPAAGTFDGWPKHAAFLKCLDPCCGSGHFMVALFLHLVPLRMAEEGLSIRAACDAVLLDNIFGLEIDERCTQIAAFALALTAWNYPDAGGYRKLPELNVACSGLMINAKEEEWLALAGDNINLRLALEELYKQFKDAPILGSLVNPEASLGKGSLFELKWEKVRPLLTKALAGEKSDEVNELAVVARGVTHSCELLSSKYSLIITNPPYLGTGKQDPKLKEFLERNFSDAAPDIATAFMKRISMLLKSGATYSTVTPQNWTFATNYISFRKSLLEKQELNLYIKVGEKGFESSAAAGAFVVLSVITNIDRPKHIFSGLDVSNLNTPGEKSRALRTLDLLRSTQKKQTNNPDGRILLTISEDLAFLSKISQSLQGIKSGDDGMAKRTFWEIYRKQDEWKFFRSTVEQTTPYGGMEYLIKWNNEGRNLARLQGLAGWGKPGVTVSLMRKLRSSIYLGEQFDSNIGVIIPQTPEVLPAIWAFCESDDFDRKVREIDPRVNAMTGSLVKVPFDLDHWTKVAEEKYPRGLPQPYSDDHTQWIFHGHPCGSVVWDENKKWTAHGPLRCDETVLQVAVARLLGYRWPAELDAQMELADEQREWVKKCEALLCYADDDGIVCIPSVRGEDIAADRVRELLAAAYGKDWSPAKERELLTATGATDPDDWLRNFFFEQHCKLFHHRPFILHIWDGRKRDGFHALINYHKLAEAGGKGRQLLEKLTYGYLGDWINRQRDGVKQGTGGAEDRLAAALELEKRLKAILEGEPPFDIFVRWKPLEQQPIGWEPDINDGVRLNIRPFLTDDIPGGKRGAGILRWKPNIKWDKDRGNDVASAPWYHLFKGERINDHHLSCDEKRRAREAAQKDKENKA